MLRPFALLLLGSLSVCDSSVPAPETTAPETTAPKTTAPLPQLDKPLQVSRKPANRGEPIAVVGRKTLLCAIRKDAPPACIGELGLALEPIDAAADDGRYERGHSELPVAIEGLDFRNLDANGYTRCFHDGGPLQCWRRNLSTRQGRLPAEFPFRNVRDVAVENQTCVVDESGRLRCTGSRVCRGPDDEGYDMSKIVQIPGIDKARIVSKDLHMGCVVLEDATVSCWGKLRGDGSCVPKAEPVPGLSDVVNIAVGDYWACALQKNNRVSCWGTNARGTLGVQNPNFSAQPIEVSQAFPAVAIDAGRGGTAALRADGSVVAWGYGTIGDGDPKRLDFARPVVDVVVLERLVCGLLDDGSIQCEGRKIDRAKETGRPRPPFEGLEPWVDAPVYRLAKTEP